MTASAIRLVKWERGILPSQEEAEARLHQEGYQAFKWYDVPGACYPKHAHGYDECIWVLKGEIAFRILSDGAAPEQLLSLKAGDRLYLPSGVPHTAQVPQKASVTYLVGQKRHD